MAHISWSVLAQCPPIEGLIMLNQGKVRDTYELPGFPEYILVVARKRISVFDFVLPAVVRQKDEILNALNIFWRLLFKYKFQHDLFAFGPAIDAFLPQNLRGNVELWKTAVVVRRLKMIPIEGIIRAFITGSAIKQYNKQPDVRPRIVYGYEMLEGLIDGSPLVPPIFTPTTKAEKGHDEEIAVSLVREKYGTTFEEKCLALFNDAYAYALERGIVLADTKLEGDQDGCLGDEWLTPDSSRYWDHKAYKKAHAVGKLPPSLDKQFVRNLFEKVLKGLDPENPAHLEQVDALEVPAETIRMTTAIYRYIFWRLTGYTLEAFQRDVMKIDVGNPRLHLEILIGSKSDLPQLEDGLSVLKESGNSFNVSVFSCHRNDDVTPEVVLKLSKANRVIAAGSKALALPGIIKTKLVFAGYSDIPIFGVALNGGSEDATKAAIMSIEELPEQPVELDRDGRAYVGPDGFEYACRSACIDQFLPKTIARKPYEPDVVSVP